MLLSVHPLPLVHAERSWVFGASISNDTIIKTISASVIIHDPTHAFTYILLVPFCRIKSIIFTPNINYPTSLIRSKNHCPKGLHFLSCKRVLRIYGIFAYEENSPFLVTRLHNYNSISSLSKGHRPYISAIRIITELVRQNNQL